MTTSVSQWATLLTNLDARELQRALISSAREARARFGLPAVDVPFVPFTRCALVCSVGAIAPSVVAREGEVVVVDTVEVRVSYDHRVCDGAQLAGLLEDFLEDFLQACDGSAASGARPSHDRPVTGDRPTG